MLDQTPQHKLSYEEQQAADRGRFLRCTKEHRINIMRDDGLFRHIHVGRPGDSCYHFNITTVPGYLFFTGDMGAFTFSRTRDMFKFMQINWDRETPSIDYRYWAEKCEAHDKRSDGCTTYDHDALEDAVKRDWREHQKHSDEFLEMPKHLQRTVAQEFQWDVLERLEQEDERGNMETIMGWSYHDAENFRDVRPFEEFWDHSPFKTHTGVFRWACWAIASTIRDYYRGGDRFARQQAHDTLISKGKL